MAHDFLHCPELANDTQTSSEEAEILSFSDTFCSSHSGALFTCMNESKKIERGVHFKQLI